MKKSSEGVGIANTADQTRKSESGSSTPALPTTPLHAAQADDDLLSQESGAQKS